MSEYKNALHTLMENIEENDVIITSNGYLSLNQTSKSYNLFNDIK